MRNLIVLFTLFLFGDVFCQGISDRLERAKEMTDSLRYDRAISLLHELLLETEQASLDSLSTLINIKLGSAYSDVEKLDIGINYYKKALEQATMRKDPRQEALSIYGIASAFQSLNQYDSSLNYYQKSVRYFSEAKDSLTLSYLYSNLSLLHYDQGNLDKSKNYSDLALEIQLIIGDKYGAGASYSNLGLIAREQGKLSDAVKFYSLSMNEYAAVDYIKGFSETLRWLGITYHKMGLSDSASNYFYNYDSIGHDLYHTDYQDKILELETKFKTAEVERDNALKQAEIEESRRQLLILYLFSFLLILASIATYLFFNQRRKRLKEASNKQIRDILQEQEMKATYALLDGQDKERKRIAAELHDNLGSILVTLNMYADTLQNKNPKEIQSLAKKISEVSQLANEETRKISHSLDSGLLKHFGLEAAIRQLTEAVSTARGIQFQLSLQIEKISSETGLEIYRIIQELVNNTLKHSQCTKVHLAFDQLGHSLSIIYEDNGIGFNKAEIVAGMGLKNIENRVKKLDGELTIDSSPGKGSTFIIEITHV
ncbi:sensor histidine kinase [Ekhidna sp.]|uniref:tetratricopeptide repeat-containing sensor histidine kinase n=1 Tax=Ekhidna sp. TaxID=2608089 RepID=UPI003299EA73